MCQGEGGKQRLALKLAWVWHVQETTGAAADAARAIFWLLLLHLCPFLVDSAASHGGGNSDKSDKCSQRASDGGLRMLSGNVGLASG